MYLLLSSVMKKITGKVTGKKFDCLVCPVRFAVILIKYEELAR